MNIALGTSEVQITFEVLPSHLARSCLENLLYIHNDDKPVVIQLAFFQILNGKIDFINLPHPVKVMDQMVKTKPWMQITH